YHLDVDLLDAVREAAAPYCQIHGGQPPQRGASGAGQAHYLHPVGNCKLRRLDHIATAATGADRQQAVTRTRPGLQVAREYVLIAEVVGHAADVAWITDGGSGQAKAILAVAAGKLL